MPLAGARRQSRKTAVPTGQVKKFPQRQYGHGGEKLADRTTGPNGTW